MANTKHLSGYADEEVLVLLEALVSPVVITFPTEAQLRNIRHRLYSLRRAVLTQAERRLRYKSKEKMPSELLHPILDKANDIAKITIAVKNEGNLHELTIGVHQFNEPLKESLSVLGAALRNRGVAPNLTARQQQIEQQRAAIKEDVLKIQTEAATGTLSEADRENMAAIAKAIKLAQASQDSESTQEKVSKPKGKEILEEKMQELGIKAREEEDPLK